ncbi:SDR family oxidoreductase [Kribbella speibonae]|uniref:SDR family oxidoreductase n=1 Tax=Kribbella speibonae TaxID=1572660 RepID=A0ABY2ADV0_9ACTN|nr:SDR family oxidoreductase [Kribbella speibonae]TCC27825.1 SDR family oxidoreductase [Kribbella speibonae]
MSSDPRTRYAGPEQQDPQKQEHPGHGGAMSPEPDYGEKTYRGSGKLTGKRALITGGDSGIGRAVALAFAREGADVMISHLEAEEQDAGETCRLVRESGCMAASLAGDIQDEQHCRRLVDHCVQELGGLDILVNNAAYQMSREGIADISTEQFDRVLKTNVYAMFWLCKAALPHLTEGSAIINTTSIQAYEPSPNLLDYATSKAAILNFTKGLAQELAPKGIRVNSVAPGPIWTPLIPATLPADKVGEFGADTPLGRAGQPAELAPLYVFLASDDSTYVTGERIGATGGRPLP